MSANSSALSPRGRMGSSRTSAHHDPGPASLLGFRFRDPSLFRRALLHRSYCNEHGLDASESYERLEFLGDAVLELIVSDRLYGHFPEANEGQLTKARASLVKRETLATVARRWGLGERLLVGRGVEVTGGRYQDSVLAAAVEAVIAAVYLDQGLEVARQFVNANMMDEFATALLPHFESDNPFENAKSRLQEYLQGQGLPTPTYRLVDQRGPAHDPVFTIEAMLGDEAIGEGQGGRKAEAERAAAEDALRTLANCSSPGEEGVSDPPHPVTE